MSKQIPVKILKYFFDQKINIMDFKEQFALYIEENRENKGIKQLDAGTIYWSSSHAYAKTLKELRHENKIQYKRPVVLTKGKRA